MPLNNIIKINKLSSDHQYYGLKCKHLDLDLDLA